MIFDNNILTGLHSKFDGCFMCIFDSSFLNMTNNIFENIVLYHVDGGIGIGSTISVYPCPKEPIVVAFYVNNTVINTDKIRQSNMVLVFDYGIYGIQNIIVKNNKFIN